MKILFSPRIMWHCKTVTVKVCEGILSCPPSSAFFVWEGHLCCVHVCTCVVGAAHGGSWHLKDFLLWFFVSVSSSPAKHRALHPSQSCKGCRGISEQGCAAVLFIKRRGNRLGSEGPELAPCRPTDADQLMHKKVPKPLLLLKGMPCLTAEVLRALLPSALCSGYAHWRPVCIHRNGSTVSIRSIWLDSQMQCWAPGHHRQAATLGRKEAS